MKTLGKILMTPAVFIVLILLIGLCLVGVVLEVAGFIIAAAILLVLSPFLTIFLVIFGETIMEWIKEAFE